MTGTPRWYTLFTHATERCGDSTEDDRIRTHHRGIPGDRGAHADAEPGRCAAEREPVSRVRELRWHRRGAQHPALHPVWLRDAALGGAAASSARDCRAH